MAALYEGAGTVRSEQLPYRRAALAFMRWQVRRGLLDPASGSPWWRAVNERLLLDTALARAVSEGSLDPAGMTQSARLCAEFATRPSARSWYRAHNASVASAYLEHRDLADAEGRVERFFLNLILVRVLYTHALVAAPRTALAWTAPVAPLLGDPRVGMTGIFLSLRRVLPDRYPLGEHLEPYIEGEHGFGRLLDVGLIRPRIAGLVDWSADELGLPELRTLVVGDVPCYAWDREDSAAWDQAPGLLARAARRILPPG